ncbi:MAG: MATE family efflux transporter [Candidatus Cloacimonetes bacterium HGW-Cloacimonetes-3]|jgi:putative MATE family efflux protein|nr:MAG: MATE family efflux transporter [Candidatus Cloacimonetes bacterium HGW-Cloacimonetes-3]
MKHSRIDILEKLPIPKAIVFLALPSVLSMLINVLYNLTDTFFIGKLNDPYQMAAVSISLPLFIFQMAISGIFGTGGGSYLSRLLGEKDFAAARETTSTAIFSSGVVSILLGIAGIILIPQFLQSVGASAETGKYASRYIFIILLGSPFVMLQFTLVQLLRAEGAAREAMNGLFIGTGANILLDPLFIFVFHMGVTGAAVATVIGQAMGMSYYLSYYLRKKSLAAPSRKYLHLRWNCYKEILFIGIPASLSQIMMGIGNTISFKLASPYGDHSIAALGVASRVLSIPIFVFIGISIGVQALIGFNYGARNYARMKKAIINSIAISMSLGVFFTALFALFPRVLISAFIKDPQIMDIGMVILDAYVYAIPFAAIGMILMASLQAMGKALPALIVALSRQGLVYIPFIYLLNHLYGFKGLVFAMPAADAITTVVSFSFVFIIVRKLKHSSSG